MKELLKKITPKFIFQNVEEIVASLLFVVTLVLVIINVLTRYVFRTGIPWAEEMATSCFVWTAFIGSAACYKMRAHVALAFSAFFAALFKSASCCFKSFSITFSASIFATSFACCSRLLVIFAFRDSSFVALGFLSAIVFLSYNSVTGRLIGFMI